MQGMDVVDALRLETIINKSGSGWKVTHAVKNHRGVRLHIRKDDKSKLVSSEHQWNRIKAGVLNA